MRRFRLPPQRETGKGGVKAAVKQYFEKARIIVYNTSGRRQFGNTKGIADLYCIWPEYALSFWFEAKAENGKLSKEQEQFASDCWGCGVTVVVGGLDEAAAWVAKQRNLNADPWPSANQQRPDDTDERHHAGQE